MCHAPCYLYNNLACREVVRSPMVEAQCSVQLCFPVELKCENMVLFSLCLSSLWYYWAFALAIYEWRMICFAFTKYFGIVRLTTYRRFSVLMHLFVYIVDGRCSLDWTGEQAPGNKDTTSSSF